MSNTSYDPFDEITNPLDEAEELIRAQKWDYERINLDELIVEVSTKITKYTLHFIWQEEHTALLFACEYANMHIHEDNMEQLAASLMEMNTRIWMGHFEMNPSTKTPLYRHTSLFKGAMSSSGVEHIEDLIDVALHESDRFHSAFHVLCEDSQMHASVIHNNIKSGTAITNGHMDLALMDIAGCS